MPGEKWQKALEHALDDSRTCAVFIGPHGISPWENEEMRSALETGVDQSDFRVIPVLLPGAAKPNERELPRFLRSNTWVDFTGPEGLQDTEAFHRLTAGIRGHSPGPGKKKRLRCQLTHALLTAVWNCVVTGNLSGGRG